MAPNPNPQRISAPMWRWIERCCALTSTATVNEQAGVWARQPGSHADATWLLANRPNDYSLQGTKQRVFTPRQGQFGRAWDWGFPSAWSGDWREIGIYSERIRIAWENGDPRTYPLFEVLCQTPEDREPEGFVFYPVKKFRVPARSHETHMHNGILTQYIDDEQAFEDLWSLYSGDPLAAWLARQEDDMTPLQNTILTNCERYLQSLVGMTEAARVSDTINQVDVPNELVAAVNEVKSRPAGTVTLSPEDRAAIVADLKVAMAEAAFQGSQRAERE